MWEKTIGQLYNNGGNIWRYWKIIGKIVRNFWDSFGLYLVNSLKGDMIILQGIIIFHGKRYSNYFDLLNEETSQRIPRSSHGGWTNGKIQNITDSAHLMAYPVSEYDKEHCLYGTFEHSSGNINGTSWIIPVLVGGWALPLWKIWVRQLGLLFPIYGKIKTDPNHQPAIIYIYHGFYSMFHLLLSAL